jgi:DNA-binding GntR family transcriptional regulator
MEAFALNPSNCIRKCPWTMNALEEVLKPINRGDGRRTAVDVYEALQSSILNGQLKPGTILSQVKLAQALQVSRTPVREAMRMLQEG